MKVISRVAILAVVGIALVASALPTSASCPNARLIGGCGGGGCKYIYTSVDGNNPSAGLVGNYWGFGGGNVLIGPGDDNGAQQAMGNADQTNFPDWVKGTPAYLAGSWGNPGSDGCVDNATTPTPKRTVVALSDQAHSKLPGHESKGAGYFAVLCQGPDGGLNYDYSLSNGNHVLKAIPYPSVASSSGPTIVINPPNPAGLAAGTYALGAGCTGMIRGYKVCTGLQDQNMNRILAPWNCGTEIPLPGTPQTLNTTPCPVGGTLFVATSLVYDSGFETLYVSESTKVSCSPTQADRPGDFRIIKKPVQRRRQ